MIIRRADGQTERR